MGAEVRKGRAALKAIIEHAQCQKTLEGALAEFKGQISEAASEKQADKRRLAFLSDEKVCQRAREVMFGVLPDYWDSLCYIEDSWQLKVCKSKSF